MNQCQRASAFLARVSQTKKDLAGPVTQKLHKETVQPSRLAFALGRARGGLLVEGLVRDGANDLKSGGFNTPPGKMHLQKQTVR